MPAYDASWYVDGSVTVTNGSDVVLGSGTMWETQVRAGDMFALLSDGAASDFYEILAVTDNTHLQLRHTWPGTTTADANYAVVRNFTGKWSVTAQVASSLAAHIREFKLTLQNNLKGDKGDTGDDGNTVLSGSGDPTVGQGVDDDWYFNYTSNDFFRKEGGAWVLRTNLQGPQGDAGVDGNRWYLAATDPGSSTGNPGDYALNTTSGDVFSRAAGGWSAVGNLKGPTGAVGPQGPQGATGATGATGEAGAKWHSVTGTPSSALGVNNDFALDTSTGNYYKKESGSWVLKGNIKGPKGDQGNPGEYGVNWIGVWASGVDYVTRDGVYHNGSSYVAKQDNTGQTPHDPATGGNDYWQVVARAGLDGEGSGDMTKADYDSNADGKVNAADSADTATYATTAGRATDADSADSVLWSAIDGIPDTFSPSAHALSAHESSTLAELNAKISDADLASTATATTSANGLMSAADKTKLDGLGSSSVTQSDVIALVLALG
jgi:hypothetical protein